MWKLFVEMARRVIYFSQEEARNMGYGEVFPEHILLGLMHEEYSTAGQILRNLGVSLHPIRQEIEKQYRRDHPLSDQEMQLNPRAKHLVDLGYESTKILNNDYIGTEHLLLGILCEEGLASRLLQAQGANVDKVTREVVRIQNSSSTLPDSVVVPKSLPTTLISFLKEKRLYQTDKENWQYVSDSMRRAIFFAQEEAGQRGENEVTPEHLLLGLLRDNDSAARHLIHAVEAAEGLSVSPKQIREEIDRTVEPGLRPLNLRDEDMRLTPRSKKIINRAFALARQHALDPPCVDTVHVLIAILEEKGPASQILAHFGIRKENIREKLPYPLAEEKSGEMQQAPEVGTVRRFTNLARQTILYAKEEARRLGENYVSTEYLLLGLIHDDDSPAVRVLEGMGISRESIRSELDRQIIQGEERKKQALQLTHDASQWTALSGFEGEKRKEQALQLTLCAKRAIDLAVDEMRQINHFYIDAEHILLGLIRERDGLAGCALTKLGINLERTRSEIIRLKQEAEEAK